MIPFLYTSNHVYKLLDRTSVIATVFVRGLLIAHFTACLVYVFVITCCVSVGAKP